MPKEYNIALLIIIIETPNEILFYILKFTVGNREVLSFKKYILNLEITNKNFTSKM